MGASFLSVLSLGGYQTIPASQKTRMEEKEKKRRRRGKGKRPARKQPMARGDVDGMVWMDGWPFFPCCLPSITAVAVRYLAVGSG